MAQKKDYIKLSAIEVYKLVVQGKLKKFPNRYLDKYTIKEIVRYLLLDVYHFGRKDMFGLNHTFFSNNYIGGFRKFFEFGDNEVLIYSFPEWDLKYWEFKKVPTYFWAEKENQLDFIRWIAMKENIDISTKEGLRKITSPIVQKYGGSRPLLDAGGLYELLNVVAQGKYKKWEITKMASWSKQEIIEATKWLVEDKLNLTPEQACGIKVADFAQYNLDGMLQRGCNHSILKALELAYPDNYRYPGTRTIILKK